MASPGRSDEQRGSTSGSPLEPLPDGWKRCLSKTSNKYYYHNALTKTNTWEHPSASRRTPARTSSNPSGDSSAALHRIQGSSHSIRRTPAQNRLEKLQRSLIDSQQTTPKASQPSASKRSPPKKNVRIARVAERRPAKRPPPASEALVRPPTRIRRLDGDSPSRVVRPASNDTPTTSTDPVDQSAHCWFADRQTNAAQPANAPPDNRTMFGSIVSFARNVVQSMLSPPVVPPSEPSDDPMCAASEQALRADRLPAATPSGPAAQRLNALQMRLREQVSRSDDDIIMTDDEQADCTDDEDEAMDWDECIQLASAALAERSAGLLVVLDTNVLVHDLKAIQLAMRQQTDAARPDRRQFLVPYIVLKELDALKSRRNGGSAVAQQAQRAIRLLHEAIKLADWRLRVERPPDVGQPAHIQITTNDDRIVQCALHAKHSERVTGVGMLSNDVNLRSIAMLHGLQAWSTDEFRGAFLANPENAST